MRIRDMARLEYLHDAVVSEIAIIYAADSKSIRIVVACDEECGYEDWSGKDLEVTLSRVLLAFGLVLGHVAGPDAVQSFYEGASTEMMQKVQELRDAGISPPATFLRLTLHSGSEIEIACDEVDVCVN
jgi:hypothetical protein